MAGLPSNGIDLLLDIGNSRIKWRAGELQDLEGFPAPAGDVAATCERLWGALPVGRVALANVRTDDLAERLCAWVAARWGLEALRIRATAQAAGVRCGYIEPERLGADRWAAIVAAHRRAGGPALAVCCGTATTIDWVDHRGHHRGGLILPGQALMYEAFFRRTGLPSAPLSVSHFGLGLGDNTHAAVARGAHVATLGAIERVAREQRADWPRAPLYVCGGAAPAILAGLEVDAERVPDLVLQGVAELLEWQCAH